MKRLLVLLSSIVLFNTLLFSDEAIYENDGALVYEGIYQDKFYLKFYKKENEKTMYLMQEIPHYHEYYFPENPTREDWCGYAAMKSAVKGITGKYARLDTLAYASVSAGYTTTIEDDIYIHHLYYLAYDKVQFDNSYLKDKIGFNDKGITSSYLLLKEVLTTLRKKGVVIVASNDFGGHFYVIVGLKVSIPATGQTTISYLLRDVLEDNPLSIYFEHVIEKDTFYNTVMANSDGTKSAIRVLP